MYNIFKIISFFFLDFILDLAKNILLKNCINPFFIFLHRVIEK